MLNSDLASKPSFTDNKYIVTLIFVTSLFMLWGIAITLGDVLNRHFQVVLHVSLGDSGLVQTSIFGAYFFMGIPAGLVAKRFGYKNGVLLGLGLYALGAFLFVPASNAESFTFFRIALFILACGLATLETVAHPFIGALGDQRTSDQRMNFAQSFNGLGAVIGPLIGSFLLKGNHDSSAAAGLGTVKLLYIVIGSVILAIAFLFAFVKVPTLTEAHAGVTDEGNEIQTKPLIRHRHFVWAAIAQFFNVAAQGGTWAFFINYSIKYVEGMQDYQASLYFSASMVMMMAGRFISTYLMRFIAPNKLLAIYTSCNIVLCLIIVQGWGVPGLVALMMLNLFMSIMFPTIFALGLKGLGKQTPVAASYIVMGVAGGAVLPPIMGYVGGEAGVAASYYLPIVCYAVILLFATKMYKVRA